LQVAPGMRSPTCSPSGGSRPEPQAVDTAHYASHVLSLRGSVLWNVGYIAFYVSALRGQRALHRAREGGLLHNLPPGKGASRHRQSTRPATGTPSSTSWPSGDYARGAPHPGLEHVAPPQPIGLLHPSRWTTPGPHLRQVPPRGPNSSLRSQQPQVPQHTRHRKHSPQQRSTLRSRDGRSATCWRTSRPTGDWWCGVSNTSSWTSWPSGDRCCRRSGTSCSTSCPSGGLRLEKTGHRHSLWSPISWPSGDRDVHD